MCENNWVIDEFAGVEAKDKRLAKRLINTATMLAEKPNSSIPQACDGNWANVKGAYRMINNKKLTPEVITMGHRQKTIERMANEGSVTLLIQDTTELDYTHHPGIKNMGLCTTSEHVKGMLVHSVLAVTPQGKPLGLLSQTYWTRDPEERGKRHERKVLPIEEKESSKWLDALDASLQGVPDTIPTVTVCDREADIYDFFQKALSEGRHLLVRASRDRRIKEEHKYLISQGENSPIAGEIVVDVPRDTEHKLPPRQARLSVQFCPITIKPPKHRSKEKLPSLPLYLVLAKEINPPEGIDPIYWVLLTTMPVKTFEDAVEKIQWYVQRWKIERYHLTLKSGCTVEELQLETLERIENALAIYSVIAWKLLYLTYEARLEPEAPCTVVLENHEWQALYCMVNKTPDIPDNPPTLNEAVRMIAKLGGFLGRKGDGQPGVMVLWRGMKRLHDISQIWLITHPTSYPKGVG